MSDDKNALTKSIVDEAVRRLVDEVGFTTEGAAALLVVQGAIRIESRDKLSEMADFVASCVPSDNPVH